MMGGQAAAFLQVAPRNKYRGNVKFIDCLGKRRKKNSNHSWKIHISICNILAGNSKFSHHQARQDRRLAQARLEIEISDGEACPDFRRFPRPQETEGCCYGQNLPPDIYKTTIRLTYLALLPRRLAETAQAQ